MSKRGQQVWNGVGVSASPVKGIEESLDASTIAAAYNPRDYPPEVVKAYVERWNRIMRQ